jgi:hypothetical protein
LDGNSFVDIFGTKTLLNKEDLHYETDKDQTCGTLVVLSSDPWLIDDKLKHFDSLESGLLVY